MQKAGACGQHVGVLYRVDVGPAVKRMYDFGVKHASLDTDRERGTGEDLELDGILAKIRARPVFLQYEHDMQPCLGINEVSITNQQASNNVYSS